MSPRHFTKAIYGPYYLSNKHYDIPQEPKTKFEKLSFYVLKYTGISKLLDLRDKEPNKSFWAMNTYVSAITNTPNTLFEKITYIVFKYTGIGKLIIFIKSPAKISKKTDFTPYQ